MRRLAYAASMLATALVGTVAAGCFGGGDDEDEAQRVQPRRSQAPSGTRGAAAQVRTLVQLPTPLFAVAQDGAHIAWMRADRRCGAVVELRAVPGGEQTELTRRTGATCRELTRLGGGTGSLALAGRRALWAVFTVTRARDAVHLITGAPGDPVDRNIDFVEFEGGVTRPESQGPPSIPVAGDGETLVYAQTGDPLIYDGRLIRVSATRRTRLPVIGARAVAAASPRVAVVAQSTRGRAQSEEPAWSPKGEQIAFESARDGDREIYVMAAEGTRTTQLTQNLASDFQPDWSPDGRTIAFASLRGRNEQVYLMHSDGSRQRRLTKFGSDPNWSPDGSKIAFVGQEGILIVNRDGSRTRRITRMEFDGAPAWSPDGRKLAFERFEEQVYVVNADGTGARKLADGGEPSWSPDGSKIAFYCGDICVMNSDGTGVRRVTHSPGSDVDFSPEWSPDGSRIAFARGVYGSTSDIYTVAPDGSALKRLTTTRPLAAEISVQVRSATGLLVSRRPVDAAPRAIALSGAVGAVLAGDSGGLRIEWFDPQTGDDRGAARVPSATAAELSVAGGTIVFRADNTIRALDTATAMVSTLATAAATPIGLSIEGRRVIWGENVLGRGRIQTLALPA